MNKGEEEEEEEEEKKNARMHTYTETCVSIC
jgi:hypothetical protein